MHSAVIQQIFFAHFICGASILSTKKDTPLKNIGGELSDERNYVGTKICLIRSLGESNGNVHPKELKEASERSPPVVIDYSQGIFG